MSEEKKLPTIAYMNDLAEPITTNEARYYEEDLPELVRRSDLVNLIDNLHDEVADDKTLYGDGWADCLQKLLEEVQNQR